MRTTLDLPEVLLREAMTLSGSATKTDVIKLALKTLIRRERIRELKDYRGSFDPGIDLDMLRDRS